MKIPIKKKDFEDKATLEKSLSTKLKKPVNALVKKTANKLPFCYEVDYFSEGKGFISIGVAKEVDKLFKTKRVKGQGTSGKIDKKKVAYGHVSINTEGQFEFCVLGGMMKGMQAKKVIKSIPILKKLIGDNFVIVKGEAPVEEAPKKEENNATGVEDAVEDTEVVEQTIDVASFINEAKNFLTEGTKVESTISSLINDLGNKINDISKTIVTDDLINQAKSAMSTLGDFSIQDFLKEKSEWLNNIPDAIINSPEFSSEKEKIDAIEKKLISLNPKSDQLIKNCGLLETVEDPTESENPPISSNPMANFGMALGKIKSKLKK